MDFVAHFTALHAIQTRFSDDTSVRLSICLSACLPVCLSVCQTRELYQNGRKLSPDFHL